MTDALQCFKCGVQLRRAVDDNEAQPDEGVMFSASGNYGSTVFDPMDGSYLLINICDRCVAEAGEQGRVLVGRAGRPVMCDVPIADDKTIKSNIGFEVIDNGALVHWNKDIMGFDDYCFLELEDLKQGVPNNIKIHLDVDRLISDLERVYENIDKKEES